MAVRAFAPHREGFRDGQFANLVLQIAACEFPEAQMLNACGDKADFAIRHKFNVPNLTGDRVQELPRK
jgi:hypothetical protein